MTPRREYKESARDLMQDIFDWDVATWSRALSVWKKFIEVDAELNCLEVGANKGGLSLWLAMNGHRVRCTDLVSPKEKALPIHREYSVNTLIDYGQLDLLNPSENGSFDLIIFKSVLGGVGRNGRDDLQTQAIKNCYSMLKPGGVLLFAENLSGSIIHRWARKLFISWGNSWNYPSPQKLSKLLSSFDKVEMHCSGFKSAFVRNEKLKNIFSRIDAVIFDPILPDSCKYVAFVTATKQVKGLGVESKS